MDPFSEGPESACSEANEQIIYLLEEGSQIETGPRSPERKSELSWDHCGSMLSLLVGGGGNFEIQGGGRFRWDGGVQLRPRNNKEAEI